MVHLDKEAVEMNRAVVVVPDRCCCSTEVEELASLSKEAVHIHDLFVAVVVVLEGDKEIRHEQMAYDGKEKAAARHKAVEVDCSCPLLVTREDGSKVIEDVMDGGHFVLLVVVADGLY